jgi:hypothetical protein
MKSVFVRNAGIAAAALLAGCGPSVERAFSNCSEVAYKQALSGNKGLLPKELAAVFEKSARAMAEKQCSIIRDECRNNPQSEECQSLVQQYGK